MLCARDREECFADSDFCWEGSFSSKVFSIIEEQTGYVVFCNYDLLKNTGPLTVAAKAMPLDKFLEMALKDQGLTFAMENKTIVISKKFLACGFKSKAAA